MTIGDQEPTTSRAGRVPRPVGVPDGTGGWGSDISTLGLVDVDARLEAAVDGVRRRACGLAVALSLDGETSVGLDEGRDVLTDHTLKPELPCRSGRSGGRTRNRMVPARSGRSRALAKPAAVTFCCLLLLAGGCRPRIDEGGIGGATTAPSVTTTTVAIDDRLVNVGGHRLRLVCYGSGTPTVLVELGARGTTGFASALLRVLATRFRSCVYERDGTGQSERGPLPLDAEHVSRDLAALLVQAGIAVPIVLVSYSLGGLYAQHFAPRHPDKIAGLVFVDPRTAEFHRGYRDVMSPEERAAEDQWLAGELSSGKVPELASIDQSVSQVIEAGPLPPVPVVVLTAGMKPREASAEAYAFWQSTHSHLAAQSSRGRHLTVPQASHNFFGHEAAILEAVVAVSRG